MSTVTSVIVNTRFSAVHSWPNCPFEEVDFLKSPHRHEFHVTVKKQVFHDDRDIEFIMLKDLIDRYIDSVWNRRDIGSMSCEMIARNLLEHFYLDYVRVMEDNENGAEISRKI
jgi:hypothetical protein